jgi:hypothetical protein
VIRIRVQGGNFEPIIRMLDQVARPDLGPLAQRIGKIMVEGNRRGLLAGTNADGSRAADLAESTIRRGRGGEGPPRVTREAGSRMIEDFRFDVQQAPDRVLVIGSWPNTPFVHFHATGAPKNNMPARDPVGIRPDDVALMGEAVEEFARTLFTRF